MGQSFQLNFKEFFYPSHLSKRDQRYHSVSQQAIIFPVILIAGVTVLIGIYRVPVLVLLGILVVILSPLGLYLNHNRKYSLAALIMAVLHLIYFPVGVVIIGWDSGLQYPLIAMALATQFNMKENDRFKLLLGLAAVVSFLALAIFYAGQPSWVSLPENILNSLLYINITMAPFPPIVSLNNFGKTLKKTEDALELANLENERLLHNILPPSIAAQLKKGNGNVVQKFENASILFADLVNFTSLAEQLTPQQVVDLLNGLFSRFDDLTGQYGLEKIKTIGDAYMVASGVPEEKTDHANLLFQFAKEMLKTTDEFSQIIGRPLQLRIGMSSGPVVAGVIGKKKFIYDLWGDTVNTAARMESYGQQGRIQLSPEAYRLLKEKYEFEKLPDVEIKGKGKMDVYLWRP